MADINPTANVSPNQDNKYITDPALLKELNSVEPTPSDASQYVTDPELLKQLNAPTTKPQTEQTVLQKLFGVEPTVGPKGPGVKELLSDIAAWKTAPEQIVATGIQAYQGKDPQKIAEQETANKIVEDARKATEANMAIKGAEDVYADILGMKIRRSDVRNLPQNLSFSLAAMGSALLSGLGTTALTRNPIAGYGAGAAAAGKVAYNIDTNSFLRDVREGLNQASIEQRGIPITNEEFVKIAQSPEMQAKAKEFNLDVKGKGAIDELANIHGLHEAGWEAIGSTVGIGAGKYIFKQALKGKILKPVAAFTGELGLELTGESATQLGQSNVERQAGMHEDAERSWLSAADWKKSYEEVAGPTLLTTALIGGTPAVVGGAKRVITKALQRPEDRVEPEVTTQPTPTPPTPTEQTPPTGPTATEEQILDHAKTRLEELERKANGIPATEIVDDQGNKIPIPARPAEFLTDQEKSEYEFLKQNSKDATKLAEGYGVAIAKPKVTGSQDTEAALGELEGKTMPVPPIFQTPEAPPTETPPVEIQEPEKPEVQEVPEAPKPPAVETPPTEEVPPKKEEPSNKMMDTSGVEHSLPTITETTKAGFEYNPINPDKPMYLKTDLTGAMRLINKLFKDPTGSYSMMTDFPQYGMLTDDINKALPKNKLRNQVVIEFRPDTLSGVKDENGEYKAFDSSFKSIEKMTIHNPGTSMNVNHPEAIEGADMINKFFTMGLNPDKSHVYSLRRSRTESEKASHREKLSKEYLDHINSQRGKLKYTYHKKIDKGLNDLQQILDQHEKLGDALKDILARIEKAIANNEYSPVDRVYPGGGPGEIYSGNDPALKGHFKYQADFYADIIKHLLTIDPVLKTNLFMDPHIISDGKNGPLVPGFYNRIDNLIALFANTDLATFIHESIHAATVHYILAHPNDPKVKQLVQILKASRKNDKRRGKNWGIYGNTNLREFIAESFSSPTFINHLMKIDPIFDKQEAKSLFDNLKTIVRNMLKAMGYKPENIKERSAFDEVMELSHGLFTGKDLEGYIYDKERLKEPVGDLMRVEDLLPAFESITAEPGADDAQLIELLGQQLYSADIVSITVKEMLQNAYDAIKPMLDDGKIKDGKIDINLDPETRTISIKDNGHGMDPKTLSTTFLTVAGSLKESKTSSGAFGVAKVQFLYGNGDIHIRTMRNGKISVLKTSGEQLKASLRDKSLRPKVEILTPEEYGLDKVKEDFPDGHGTIAEVKSPESYIDQSGETVIPKFSTKSYDHYSLSQSPLRDNIQITLNGNKVYNVGKDFDKNDYETIGNVKYPWGTVHIYASKKREEHKDTGPNVTVLCDGLYQFLDKIPIDWGNTDYGSKSIQRDIYFDIIPSIKAGTPGYPFALDREQFTKKAQEDLEKLKKFIWAKYKQIELRDSSSEFGSFDYLNKKGNKITATKVSSLETNKPIDNSNPLNASADIESKNGKLTPNEKKVPLIDGKNLDNIEIDADQFKVDQSKIDPNKTMLHSNLLVKHSEYNSLWDEREKLQEKMDEAQSVLDNTQKYFPNTFDETPEHKDLRQSIDKIYDQIEKIEDKMSKVSSDGSWVSIADVGREKFGDRFDGFMYDIGDVFRALRDRVVVLAQNGDLPTYGKSYNELKDYAVGISFDQEYLGVNIKLPFNGIFVNPIFSDFKENYRTQAMGLFGTMIHELAHYQHRNHGVDFGKEMQRIVAALEADERFDINDARQELLALYKKNYDILTFLNELGEKKYDTKPIGVRLQDEQYERRAKRTIGDLAEAGSTRQGSEGLPKSIEQRYTTSESMRQPQPVPSEAQKEQVLKPTLNTNTPNFKRWFGKSKIVNPDGSPKVMYHGTAYDIDAFNTDIIFVTEDPAFANYFTGYAERRVMNQIAKEIDKNPEEKLRLITQAVDQAIADKRLGTKENSNGMYMTSREDYINSFMQNPFIRSADSLALEPVLLQVLKDRMTTGKNIIPLYVKSDNPYDYDNKSHVNKLIKKLKEDGASPQVLLQVKNHEGNWSTLEDHFDTIKELGFDGVYVREDDTKNLAVFNPNQVKSATGNIGLYSPESNIITAQQLSEQDFISEAQSRQIFNYRGDTININEWEIPEEGKIAAKLSKWFQEFADEHVTLTKVQNAIKALGRIISDMSDMDKKQELKNSRITDQLLTFVNKEVDPILKEMLDKNVSLEEINKYLHARHAEEYNNRMNEINHKVDTQGNIIPFGLKDRASGMSTQDANNYLNSLTPERERILKNIAEKWYAIRDKTQELLVDSGQETQETIDLWNEIYPDYVPLNREQEQQAMPSGLRTGVGIDTRGNFAKRAMGSEKQVISIVDALLYQRERAIARSENNEVGKAVYRLALENPSPDFWMAINPDAIYSRDALIQEIQDMGYPNADEIADNIMAEPKERYLRKVKPSDMVIDPTTGLPIPNSKEVVDARISRNARFGENVLTLKINGRERYVFFNKKNPNAMTMVRALKNLDSQTVGRLLQLHGRLTHYFGQIYTALNPIFGIVNGARDFLTFVPNLTTTPLRGKQLQVSKKIFPAMMGIMSVLRNERSGPGTPNSRWQQIYKEARAAGFQVANRYAILKTGEDQTYINEVLNKFKDSNTKKGFRYVVDMIYDFSSMIENAVRLATYQQMREEGYSPQQSASVAKNITINFDKKGSRTQTLRLLYVFFNASIRGSVRLGQTLSGPAGKQIIGIGMFIGVMQALMIAAAGFKDDDPPEYIREHNLIIPTGDGKYTTIPMPYGFNILPNTGRIITEYGIDVNRHGFHKSKAGKASMKFINAFINAFNPLGSQGLSLTSLIPTLETPFAAVWPGGTNKNAFGQTISKQDSYTRPTPGYMRTKETGSKYGKEIARWINLLTNGTDYTKGAYSPTGDDIDFLANTFFGPVLGSIAKTERYVRAKIAGEEVPAYQVPVLGRFRGEIDSKPVITSRFYNNINAMYEHELTLKNIRNNMQAKREYLAEHPEARLWKRAESVEAEINNINAMKKKLEMANRPAEQKQRLDNKKIIIMNRFNDMVEKLREQAP